MNNNDDMPEGPEPRLPLRRPSMKRMIERVSTSLRRHASTNASDQLAPNSIEPAESTVVFDRGDCSSPLTPELALRLGQSMERQDQAQRYDGDVRGYAGLVLTPVQVPAALGSESSTGPEVSWSISVVAPLGQRLR